MLVWLPQEPRRLGRFWFGYKLDFQILNPKNMTFCCFSTRKNISTPEKFLETPFLALIRPLWKIGRLWRFWFSQKLDFQILNPKNRFLPDFGPEKMFDPAKIFRTFVPVVPWCPQKISAHWLFWFDKKCQNTVFWVLKFVQGFLPRKIFRGSPKFFGHLLWRRPGGPWNFELSGWPGSIGFVETLKS